MNDDLDLGYQVHGQTHVSSELAQVTDGLQIDLVTLDLIASLFLQSISHVLRGDRSVQFPGFPGFGSEGQHHTLDLAGQPFEFFVLLGTADFSLRLNSFNLFQRARGGQHGQSLRDEKIAAIAISDSFYVASTAKFVNILNQHYFHFFKPFLG